MIKKNCTCFTSNKKKSAGISRADVFSARKVLFCSSGIKMNLPKPTFVLKCGELSEMIRVDMLSQGDFEIVPNKGLHILFSRLASLRGGI